MRGLKAIKLKILKFDGKGIADDYLNWEQQVEKLFECYAYHEQTKIRMVVLDLYGRRM